MVAFATSQGDEPHSLKIGWHLERPKKLLLMYRREGRESACALSLASQNCRTADFVIDLTWSFVGWVDSQVMGGGRPYWRQRPRTFQNHDLEDGLAEAKMLVACLARMLSPPLSLQS